MEARAGRVWETGGWAGLCRTVWAPRMSACLSAAFRWPVLQASLILPQLVCLLARVGLDHPSQMGPLKPESSLPHASSQMCGCGGWSTAVLPTRGGDPPWAQSSLRTPPHPPAPCLPPRPPSPALPGSVSAQALAPTADPPRYTFAPSASLNKTARPFGVPLPADNALQQNGYVGPAHPRPCRVRAAPHPRRPPLPPLLPTAAQSALCPRLAGTVRQRPLVAGVGLQALDPSEGVALAQAQPSWVLQARQRPPTGGLGLGCGVT